MSSAPAARTELSWRVAKRCESGACVRVATSNGMILLGDSKRTDDVTLNYTPHQWKNFIAAIKNGDFDNLL